MTTPLNETLVVDRDLYDRDYCLWLSTTASRLRDRQFDRIDIDNLIEEIEDMGKDKRRELQSRLRVLLMHLLKYQYQPERRSSSWIGTILEHFDQIESLLKDSPSLKPYYLEIFSATYSKAVSNARALTKMPLDEFPSESPFSPQDVINSDFIFSMIARED